MAIYLVSSLSQNFVLARVAKVALARVAILSPEQDPVQNAAVSLPRNGRLPKLQRSDDCPPSPIPSIADCDWVSPNQVESRDMTFNQGLLHRSGRTHPPSGTHPPNDAHTVGTELPDVARRLPVAQSLCNRI